MLVEYVKPELMDYVLAFNCDFLVDRAFYAVSNPYCLFTASIYMRLNWRQSALW